MFLLNFYRFYCSCLAGILVYLFLLHSVWLGLVAIIISRTAWFFIERFLRRIMINKWFAAHQGAFKQQFGPYGIRLVNKAESDAATRESLAEVFTPDPDELRKNVQNLEVMDVMFKAGMRPDGDAWQLHDLKLKYGKFRLEKLTVSQ
jgi:hypothetical protein